MKKAGTMRAPASFLPSLAAMGLSWSGVFFMKRLFLAAATAASFGLIGAAHANITPTLTSVTAEGANFRYSYQVTLDSDQGLINGSKIAIYDFAGFAGGLTTSDPVFAAGTEFTSAGLTNPNFTDDPTVLNLTMTWTDGAYHTSGGPFPETNYTLTALSRFRSTTFDGYSSRAVKNNGATVGLATNNTGPVAVPFAGGIPEPASWALMILGFGGVGAGLRRRRTGIATV